MTYRYSKEELSCKVYVGNLGASASRQELEDEFRRHGSVKNVWVSRNPAGFAFVEFEDPRDAEDAVRGLDGRKVCGNRIQVEMSTGEKRSRGRGGGRGGGRGMRVAAYDDKCYSCNERGHFARDCRNSGRSGGGGGGGRSYGRRSRSRSRSRDRSYSPRRRDYRSRSYSRSPSPRRYRGRSSSDRD